jgi:hypothetical protein
MWLNSLSKDNFVFKTPLSRDVFPLAIVIARISIFSCSKVTKSA